MSGMREIVQSTEVSTAAESVTDAVLNGGSMRTRLGRPQVPEDEKRRPVGVSLSPEALEVLKRLEESSGGKSRSEIIESIIRRVVPMDGEPAFLSSVKVSAGPRRDLSIGPSERQNAMMIASQAINAWIMNGPPRPAEEVAAAIETIYASTMKALRANRSA